MSENTHRAHSFYECIDAYIEPVGNWKKYPKCELSPKVWEFDNGKATACGCWTTMYSHFSIYSESILSVYTRCGNTIEYDSDGLRKNWNNWCETGEVIFEHASNRTDGRW